jgi:hypothetical protein
VTWQHDGAQFFIHPREISEGMSTSAILQLARDKCSTATSSRYDTVQRTAHEQSTQATQTDFPPLPSQPLAEHSNLVTALRQDLALAKQRIAAQSVQCCFWRNKFRTFVALSDLPSNPTCAAPTNSSAQTELQTLCDSAVQTDVLPASVHLTL